MAEVFPNAGIVCAQIVGESDALDGVMNTLKGYAQAEATKHRKSGAFGSSFVVRRVRGRRGVTDRELVSRDPLAAPKEFGHALVRDGKQIGYVKPQRTMRNALERMPRVT